MLRRKALRKIIITTFSIITVFLICIIPSKINNDNNYLNPKIDTIYVNAYQMDIYLLGDNDYLVKTNVILNGDSLEDKIKNIIDYLTINKSSRIPEGLNGIIPPNTKLNNLNIDNGIVTLDFNNELFNLSRNLEERVIEAIVYSLIDIDGVEGVTIKVDGNLLTELPISNKKIPNILNRSFGINKVFEFDHLQNIDKVVLYYIDNINNNSYYVPVTKYLNDDREKIKIIIDNLSSNYIYESNLISLVNQDTELINYEIVDKTMTLNFNNNIFTNNKLLEEVVYPISKSVFESYDVDSILFQVNGKDINIYEKCCGLKNVKY